MVKRKWVVTPAESDPTVWSHQTCALQVGVWGNTGPQTTTVEDEFSKFDFLGPAQQIVQQCLGGRHGGRQVGGRAFVGPKRVFQVMIKHIRASPHQL